jgi:hypothetical protein
MFFPDIRLYHTGIIANFLGRPGGDDAAFVQYHHPVAEAHDHMEIVIHDQKSDIMIGA